MSPPAKPRISARASVSVAMSGAEAEQQRPGRGAGEQGGLDPARPEPVEQDAERQLEQRKGEQIGRGQEAELGRAQADLGDQARPDHRVHRAKEIGRARTAPERGRRCARGRPAAKAVDGWTREREILDEGRPSRETHSAFAA
jgi:hypothetical protein